ncbi:MAG: hypothetical protein HYX21_00470 [Candidatus Yanofskybacteria bacterium]|nr:hypothetical protein [Candidatus Yanofskybacteria bacterium]
METETIPVFVFLDENIANMDEKILEFFQEETDEKFDFFTLFFPPFPIKTKPSGKKKGNKDYQVMQLARQSLFSNKHILKCLFQDAKPRFVFLTRDRDFLEDVMKEKKEDNQQIGGIIMPAENKVLFIEKELSIPLSIVWVKHGQNVGSRAMSTAVSQTLKNFLVKHS